MTILMFQPDCFVKETSFLSSFAATGNVFTVSDFALVRVVASRGVLHVRPDEVLTSTKTAPTVSPTNGCLVEQ